MAQYSHGRIVAKKWPRKQGPVKTKTRKELVNNFTLLAQAAGHMVPEDRIAAQEYQVGTQYTWRDLFYFASHGKLLEIHTKDGDYLAGWRIMATDIQAMLDTISQQPGCILVRTQTEWAQLVPGDTGTVLTSQGKNAPPDFLPASGGGGSAGWVGAIGDTGGSGGVSSSAYACKGNVYTAQQKGRLNGLLIGDGVSGQTEEYQAWCAILDDTYTVLKVIAAPPLTLTTNTVTWWEFGTLLEWEPGDLVAWGVALTTAPTNTTCGVIFPSVNGNDIAALLYKTSIRSANNTPKVGDTLSTVLGSHVVSQLSYELYNAALAG